HVQKALLKAILYKGESSKNC
ncbi:hypothetical protein, partial [Bacillus subtilis]